jgi:hypothetical protein
MPPTTVTPAAVLLAPDDSALIRLRPVHAAGRVSQHDWGSAIYSAQIWRLRWAEGPVQEGEQDLHLLRSCILCRSWCIDSQHMKRTDAWQSVSCLHPQYCCITSAAVRR